MNVANFARRRALLGAGLAFPLLAVNGKASTLHHKDESVSSAECLFSGLAGLDHAVGGVAASQLACVTSPPHSGKTLMLLDWAARICVRYGKNVVFYSANEPSVDIARKGVAKGRARVFFAGETQSQLPCTRELGSSGSIFMLDKHNGNLEQAQTLATWLKANHSAGCAALVSDGWCTTQRKPVEVKVFNGAVTLPTERWAPTFLPAEKLSEAAEFARLSGLPVVMGVQTASLVEDDALADSLHLSLQLLRSADRWVSMYRPEIYVDTEKRVAATETLSVWRERVRSGALRGLQGCGLTMGRGSLRRCEMGSSCGAARWSDAPSYEMFELHVEEWMHLAGALGSGLANSKRYWFGLLGD